MTFEKALKDIYSEELSKYGYKYSRKHGFFVKLVNGELIHYVGCIKRYAFTKGKKAFTPFAGILSIYAECVEKADFRQQGDKLSYFCYHLNAVDKRKQEFEYDDETMLDMLKLSLEQTKEFIIPTLEKVTTLDAYICYRKQFRLSILAYIDKFSEDSLVLIKADNHDDFQDVIQKYMKDEREGIEKGLIGGGMKEYERFCNIIQELYMDHMVLARDAIYNDSELYAKAVAEADRRREANLEFLKQCKVI